MLLCKWGVCLDFEAYHFGLFQSVVQYTIDGADDKAIILFPKTTYQGRKTKIMELQTSPKFNYDEKVIPYNHPDIIGIVVGIYWHFDRKCFYYKIKEKEKIKKKRYFANDLFPYTQIT